MSDENILFAPAPESKESVDEPETKTLDPSNLTVDDIIEQIESLDENGHTPCTIVVSLERISNVRDGQSIENIRDEDRTSIDEVVVKECSAETYALNPELVNLVFAFDSPADGYLSEVNDILKRYKAMQENMQDSGDVPMLTVVLMPDKFEGKACAMYTFPSAFFRTLSDSGENTLMHMLFPAENIQFSILDISENDESQIKADAMRLVEEGTGGQLFE